MQEPEAILGIKKTQRRGTLPLGAVNGEKDIVRDSEGRVKEFSPSTDEICERNEEKCRE